MAESNRDVIWLVAGVQVAVTATGRFESFTLTRTPLLGICLRA